LGAGHLGYDGLAGFGHVVEGDAPLIPQYPHQLAAGAVDDSPDGAQGFAELIDIGDLAGLRPPVQTGAVEAADLIPAVAVLVGREFRSLRSLVEAVGGELVKDAFESGFRLWRSLLFRAFAIAARLRLEDVVLVHNLQLLRDQLVEILADGAERARQVAAAVVRFDFESIR